MSKRILVIGAGFAGMWSALASARLLDEVGRTDIEIVLVAPEAELHVRPRLYEQNPGGMKAPLQEIFKAVGVRFVQGYVERIDVANQQVEVSSTAETSPVVLGFDRLVLAAGSRLFKPQISGLDEHAFNVDQVASAATLEAHIETLATRPASIARNTVVVAGGGFTGIETAAEMPARLREVLGGDAQVNVIIVERASEIGPDLGAGPRPVIIQALTELGVKWKLGSGVAAVDAAGVTLESGERIEASTVIWTAGARASKLTAQVPAERDSFGRLHVDNYLKVRGLETVYATGDVAYAAVDDAGNYAMMSCQHAMNLGRSAGHNVAADLVGDEQIPYSQPKYVTCLDLGPWGAVYTEGWEREVKLVGAEAKALKTKINTEWIYPPSADRAEALASADPRRIVVA
ncbi:pyridine nucleotide-disulfide oxidoreductase [Cupriavidus sp. SHE]|jgi:NADH:ubiquinone reductase (H+-translocating)|uniref:NAD(P)/FAD-dependent oxidoreductase n=1 Tax=Cupriavidus metallidurans TaxID=119219 RepID=A0A2L0X3M2_9BURK|nr:MULTISPECIES: NAD(P)/FAD-dependent oxidoreductase [Cupriavidus]AVA34716.1 NAD(P)/FAD-dependent oxidoreductase [Cupriavidus metallidurans]KWR80798.1 pyridine nucleotide-disulfide oxidoreductase [Cupriavidus sp. SHE]QBP12239.1 NAD(P)/FAD-dependent oxidoreductase [Cupriavidus metallidurans]